MQGVIEVLIMQNVIEVLIMQGVIEVLIMQGVIEVLIMQTVIEVLIMQTVIEVLIMQNVIEVLIMQTQCVWESASPISRLLSTTESTGRIRDTAATCSRLQDGCSPTPMRRSMTRANPSGTVRATLWR